MPSISAYSLSFEKLESLHQSAKGMASLTLPERPSESTTDHHRYLDSAISMLSDSAVSLYANYHYMDSRFDRIETQLGKTDREVSNHFRYLNKRLDKDVNQQFDKIDQRFDKVDQRVRAVEFNIKAFKDEVNQRFDEVYHRFDEVKAVNFNRFAKVLHAHIRKVAAPIQDGNGRTRYEVASGFPKTIKQFWLLQRDIKKLISLAKHYSVEGWEDWQSLDQEDSEATQYNRIEYAVMAHPEQCLQALAATWGLEYGQLERVDKRAEETHFTSQKRKADDETEPRRVKARRASNCVTELSISSTESQELIIRRKTIKSEPEVKVHRRTTLEEIMEQHHVPGHSQTSGTSVELGWETSSSARVARHFIRAAGGASPPAPDGKRRVPHVGTVVDEDRKGKD